MSFDKYIGLCEHPHHDRKYPLTSEEFFFLFYSLGNRICSLGGNPCSDFHPHSFAWPLLWSHMNRILPHVFQCFWLLLFSMTSSFIQVAVCTFSSTSLWLRIIPLLEALCFSCCWTFGLFLSYIYHKCPGITRCMDAWRGLYVWIVKTHHLL